MPGLARYQAALASAASGRQPDGEARALLAGLSEAGIAMTARVRRSWCMGRARRAAPLTLSALPVEQRTALLAGWVEAGGGTGSFFEQEADAFLAFIAARLEEPSHAMSLCRFERAAIRARSSPFRDQRPPPAPHDAAVLVQAPDADLVALRASPESLLGALGGGRPWPGLEGEPQHLLIAPGIEGLVRAASDREIAFWQAAEAGVLAGEDIRTARGMIACGALYAEASSAARPPAAGAPLPDRSFDPSQSPRLRLST